MPIPEYPQSRSEQYLDAIATGDNSGLPAFPQSRMEQYLEVIAQNGGGGSSGGGVLVVHTEDAQNVVLTGTLPDVSGYKWKSQMSGTLQYYVSITCDLDGYDLSTCTVTIGDDEYSGDDLGYLGGTLNVHVGGSGTGHENESDVLGKTITVTTTQTRLDKTWQEIYDAGFCVLELPIGGKMYGVLAQIVESDGYYVVVFVMLGETLMPQMYVINSANGYPVYTEDA